MIRGKTAPNKRYATASKGGTVQLVANHMPLLLACDVSGDAAVDMDMDVDSCAVDCVIGDMI